MKYLVFSDIHGNATALRKIVEEIDGIGPDFVVSLGDVVGYGANPVDCVEIVDSRCDFRICGNHDFVAAGYDDGEDFNMTARIAIEWTKNSLSSRHKKLLSAYDTIKRHGECVFAHSSPVDPLDWEYVYTLGQAKKVFKETDDRFILIGHTHVPGIIGYDPSSGPAVERSSDIEADPGRRYLINVGSIGQPRDGVCASSFAIVDSKKNRISIRRVPYDISEAQDNIRAEGLPESLASRLATAR